MKRPVVPIVLALVLALVAAFLVYLYARSAENRALQDQQPVSVLISAKEIPAGVSLGDANSQGLLTSTQVAEKVRPAGSISEVTAANSGLVALAAVPAGQILMTSSFGIEVPTSAALEVPDGLMAVTVQLEDPAKVGTFLRPGSEIAVFDTVKLPAETEGGDPVSKTIPILDRVEVLAVGDVAAPQEASATAESWVTKLVTVAVDQAQAERLVHGAQTGALYMALLGDTTTLTPSKGLSDQDLFN